MINERQTAAKLLLKMEKGAYSNIALNAALTESSLPPEKRKLVSRLFYGVTERKITLDYIISLYSKRTAEKLDREVLTALRIGLYELVYCDGIPDSASVNEAVRLTKLMGKASASGLVNGVLRSFLRDGKRYPLPKDKSEEFSVKYSVSRDIAGILLDSLSYDDAASLLEYSFLEGDMTLRTNTLKISPSDLITRLHEENIDAVPTDVPFLDGALKIVSGTDKVIGSAAFSEGLFHIQDISSQICAYAVSPEKGDTVIDICAAPGGKSFTMAEMMNDTGKIISCDLHEKRVGLIEKGAKKLGITNIKAIANDGKVFSDSLPAADRVLCDVPCSGLGTMRGKPEIKYKSAAEIAALPEIQYKILDTSSKYVKSGGYLVYSTCTVNKAENEAVTERFLESHPDFYGTPFLQGKESFSVTLLPRDFGGDGFYICKMRRK